MDNLIHVSEPLFGRLEEDLVLNCIRSGWISSEGSYVRELEKKCAAYCSTKYGVAVSSGTAALQIALQCLQLKPDEEVILPTFTMISCAIAVIEAGAKPVLVDCDPLTYTMKVEDIEKKITQKTKAIMVVHIYGHPVNMDIVLQIAKKYNLNIIEDAAESFGAEYKGRKCGGLGDISILSFYANKLITTGEGGMVLTDNANFYERAMSLRNMCFRKDIRFYHTEIGHNYRLTNLQAAIGVAQFERIEQFIARKIEMADMYARLLNHLPLQLPIEKEWAKNVYWMYAIVIDASINMDAKIFSELLLKKGVQTRPFFIGMHQQPVFKKMGYFNGEQYPVCEKISKKGLYLPSGQALTDEQIRQVCSAVNQIIEHYREDKVLV